jgi:hypothetical protein
MDVYRNNYPTFLDTVCDNKISLVNKSQVNHSFLDSVFKHVGINKTFSLDSAGSYFVETTEIIEVNGVNYETAKVQYLANGQNVDQEFLLYVVKGKGIYIQQESHDRKLYLLMNIKDNGKSENTSSLTDKMIKDTVLFPLPPKPPIEKSSVNRDIIKIGKMPL